MSRHICTVLSPTAVCTGASHLEAEKPLDEREKGEIREEDWL